MPYSTNLTDAEWEILSPLLKQILPHKKKTRPPNWTQREILNGIFYQLKNGGNWADLPKDLPPYSTVYWHYCVIPKNQLCITSPYFSSLQLSSLVCACIPGLARFNFWLIAGSNN